jgi:predicted nuclease of predicted toxin-antitoxin system
MKLYLDDDTAEVLLANLLRNAGHDVQLPSEVGMVGELDPVHLTHAIVDGRVCMTKNYDDYWLLHALVMKAKGTHPGIVVIRQDNDPRVVAALRKLQAAGVPIENEYIVLNHWR